MGWRKTKAKKKRTTERQIRHLVRQELSGADLTKVMEGTEKLVGGKRRDQARQKDCAALAEGRREEKGRTVNLVNVRLVIL